MGRTCLGKPPASVYDPTEEGAMKGREGKERPTHPSGSHLPLEWAAGHTFLL
jgi:hypothetical protein